MKKQKNKLAFSLIELSVVILIIGILVVGITKGSRIIYQTNLVRARSLTTNSPVTTTSDLVVWYETSLTSSFNSTDAVDGKVITGSWFNNAPFKGNDTSSVVGSPTYYQSVINNLPAIRFDGASGLTFDAGPYFTGKYYTAFVVEQRRTGNNSNRFLNILSGSSSGYVNTTTIDSPSIPTSGTVVAYNGTLIPRILTLMTGTTNANTRGIFINGGTGSTPAVTASDSVLGSSVGAGKIGQGFGTFYTGDIAEVIVFNRTLTLNERNAIQEYLGKKYNIKITPST